MNIEFQSEHHRLYKLHFSVSSKYKNIVSFFIKERVLNLVKLADINLHNGSNYKNLDDIYLGGRAILHLKKVPFKEDLHEKRFRNDCLEVFM